jgi:ComEC/Rec2-related protein
LGYREELDKNVQQQFSAAGAMHILAVSGLHTGIVWGLIVWILTLGGWAKPLYEQYTWQVILRVLTLLALWTYAFITGLSPSVMRSALMVSIVEIGWLTRRNLSGINSLAAAAVIILLINPLALWSVSFQLSFAATAAIVLFMSAWSPALRSKSAVRTSDTRYFVDPSIASVALGATPENLLSDLRTFGVVFETLAIRDLRVYSDAAGGDVRHYLDRNGLECDAVIHLRNGAYGLVEVKLGGDRLIEEGARSLHKLHKKIDTDRMKEPSFMAVLVANGDYAYRRIDGVWVIPIGSLKP